MSNTTIPELYLIVDLNRSPDPLIEIEAVCKEATVVSVLLTTKEDSPLPKKQLIEQIQALNIAVLIEHTVESREQLDVDGIHINEGALDVAESDVAESDSAQNINKLISDCLASDLIVGVTTDRSRHQAMVTAEKGISYIAIKTPSSENKLDPQKDNQTENETPPTIEWWNTLFETPCIAWEIENKADALNAYSAGADYLALAPSYWQQKEKTEESIKQLMAALKSSASQKMKT